MRFIDLSGQKFGKLTVICEEGKTKGGKALWKCKCDCGNETHVVSHSLKSGNTTSCSCIRGKGSTNINTTTHGLSGHPLYNVWLDMKQRCASPNDKRYKDYGGRGIKCCESWSKFENFYSDMAEGYKKGLQIDRINNDGNYCKENCRWSTRIEQANNNSRNRYVTIEGITDTVANHARRLGISYQKIYQKLLKNN